MAPRRAPAAKLCARPPRQGRGIMDNHKPIQMLAASIYTFSLRRVAHRQAVCARLASGPTGRTTQRGRFDVSSGGALPMTTTTMTETSRRGTGMTKEEKFVIVASSTGTVFEWYDFY